MRAALQVEKYKNRHCRVIAPVKFSEERLEICPE
jgi:hypothetical protein